MDQIVFPTSLGEVEALVLELYKPGPPQKIAKIQETLQTLQRSSEGWQLADSLLANADEKIRFFGALTFIVKINTDSQNLSEADARSLLQTLLGWLNRSLEFPEGPLVVKKLCSVLVAYFIQFSASWTRCVRHVLYCLCLNQVVPYEELDKAPETGLLVQSLPKPRALAILWFSMALVEEVGKTDSNSMKHHQFHQRLLPNVDDIVVLVKNSIGDSPQAMSVDIKIRQDSLACYQAWVLYSHRAFVDAAIVLEPLRSLTKPAIMCLLQDDLYEISVELFSDVLANYSRFLGEEEFGLLHSLFNSSWAQERYERLIAGDFDFDSQQFGMFMIAFGDATVQDLVQKAHSDVKCGQFLAALAGLLETEGLAVHEDKIFVPALEFWATFVETMIDESYSRDGGEPPWLQAALAHLMKAVENCWRKIQFPPNEVFSSWDSADRTAFNDARKDVSDLLEQAYTQTGPALFSMFVDMILRSTQSEVWAELEASLYCLKAFPDCVSSDEVICDDLLDKVFGSSIFSMFADPEKSMPPRARQTFLDLIASYSDYFERHTKYLPNALDILFKAIESLPGLAEKASKSVLSLCSSCRGLLVPEVGIFLQEYSKFAHVHSLDSLVKERTLGAIASIIQAIPESAAKLGPLDQLLRFVEVDIEQSLVLLRSKLASNDPLSTTSGPQRHDDISNYEVAQGLALMSLRCLGSIARGLQVPNDVPVDIDGNGVASTFWTTDKGAIIQQRIVTMIVTTLDAFGHQGDIVEAACFIFRAGFTEHESGPFVLPLLTVARVLQKFTLQTPRLGIAISTACSLVSSQSAVTNRRIDDILRELLVWVSQLLYTLGEPHNDPEIAQYGIEFMQRLVEKDYLDVLLNHQPPSSLEYLFMFTLKALTGKEFLPKFASAEFWSSLVSTTVENPETRASVDIALKHFGPLLAQALVYNIGGNAARSELDRLAEPLKKLVVRGVQSKSWLETALFGDEFRNTKVSAAEKKVFLQKIINLRGARGTNQVVRDFWLACRGSNFAYAS